MLNGWGSGVGAVVDSLLVFLLRDLPKILGLSSSYCCCRRDALSAPLLTTAMPTIVISCMALIISIDED